MLQEAIKETSSEIERQPSGSCPKTLKFPNDRQTKNAWQTYEPSITTKHFLSEKGHTLFGENFEFDNVKGIDALKLSALKLILKHFKCAPLDERIQSNDKIYFGENLDTEFPLQHVADLDNEVYWKRVCQKKCKVKWLYEKACNEKHFNWRKFGVELKIAELFENTKYSDWNIKKFSGIAKKVQKYIDTVDIRQMHPMPEYIIEKSPYNGLYKIFDYPPKDCHHGNLGAVLPEFINLTSLSIRYGPLECKYSFHRRLFDVSYDDIETLASGLETLKNLKEFSLTRSRLDDRKIKILCRGLMKCPLEKLNLSYCFLCNDSGKALGCFLQKNRTLKELELRENQLGPIGLHGIGYGLRKHKGQLKYIGLAKNPVEESGILCIGGGFCETNHITKLDFCGCDVGPEGAFRIAQIVGFHLILEYLDMCSTPLGSDDGADKLINNVKKNIKIMHLECRECGLTENQERKIKLLLERNLFYKENPCLAKNFFEKEDEEVINAWIKKIKHPMLNCVLDKTPSKDSFDVTVRKTDFGCTIPSFIPENQQKIPPNAEILRTPYFDCDEENDQHNVGDNENACFKYNPNSFGVEDFLDTALVGQLNDLSSSYYFN